MSELHDLELEYQRCMERQRRLDYMLWLGLFLIGFVFGAVATIVIFF